MARDFNGAMSVRGTQTRVVGMPFSMFIWARHNSIANSAGALGLVRATALDEGAHMMFRGDTAGDPVQLRYLRQSTQSAVANSAGSYSADTWTAIGCTCTGATDKDIYLNGVGTKATTNQGDFANGVAPNFTVGAFWGNSTVSDFLNGAAVMAAMWNGAALTADEHMALAKGFPPRRIRPQQRCFYMPLIGGAPFLWDEGSAITNDTTTTNADNPRLYGF